MMMKREQLFSAVLLGCGLLPHPAGSAPLADPVREPYARNTGLDSRSISFENPTGARGTGGQTASNLEPDRKGSPSRNMKPGESVTLCDIEGPGTIRHIWITTRRSPDILRGSVVRVYWEGQDHPSIECPPGDFMGFAHGKVTAYQSAVHSVGPSAGMNLWLPMPFTKRAWLTFSNEVTNATPLFYQIDYTLGDKHPKDVGRLHTLFRRENPTTLKQAGLRVAAAAARRRKVHWFAHGHPFADEQLVGGRRIQGVSRDGDKELPTICGTGSEDYVGLS